ncbi:MAG: ATP synthase F1 subunit epsilon [Clostridiales bacterium]|nr:ATP synthase F1 subunit epsilon [Clostridiales bacterium]
MSSFHLQIVTPDGLFYDGEAESLDVRAVTGGVTILPKHINYVTPLGMGQARVVISGKTRRAACIGGMLMVKNGEVRLIATTFEWQEQIDRARAQRALETAQERLKHRDALTDEEIRLAEAKLRRALVRTSLTENA